MLIKNINYVDYFGNEQEDEFAFHLNTAEVLELRFAKRGGLENYLQRVVREKDAHEMIVFIKDIIRKSVGKVSDDGKQFIKNNEVRDAFMQTEAYPVLLMELASDSNKMIDFVRSVVPADIGNKVTTEEIKEKMNEIEAAKSRANITALPKTTV